MLIDAIETMRAAVDDHYLIKRLDLKYQLSQDGEVHTDLPLHDAEHKGLHIFGYPRKEEPGRYLFKVRGSLIRFANGGVHNNDFKSPFALLSVLDELATDLRIDPFSTSLNGLELSVTVPTPNPGYCIDNLLSYINNAPNRSLKERDGILLPYSETEAGQHTMKLYSPAENALRLELKVNKMQFLGKDGPRKIADLADPTFIGAMVEKLTAAFSRIIWDCYDLDADTLTAKERDLVLCGRDYRYWQVNRKKFGDEFKRIEKQREREKKKFQSIALRHWTDERPVKLHRKIISLVNRYANIMHSQPYRNALNIYRERWQIVGNLPTSAMSPKLPPPPTMSEIYISYLGSFPTTSFSTPTNTRRCPVTNAPLSYGQSRGYQLGITTLREKPELLQELQQKHRQRKRKRTCHDEAYYAAHNVRNARSNLRRQVERAIANTSLFNACDVIRLSPEKRALLDQLPPQTKPQIC